MAIVRTCKQIGREYSVILYGENTYQFDVDSGHTHTFGDSIPPWNIPGFSYFKKVPDISIVTVAIDELFELNYNHPPIISKDRFIRSIAYYIGRKNTSFLRNLTFNGYFKTRSYTFGGGYGFVTTLPVYTLIVGGIRPNPRNLTLHQPGFTIQDYNWTKDLKVVAGMSDEDMIEGIVAKVVLGLPSLQELQLGAHSKVPGDSEFYLGYRADSQNGLGISLQWMKFVHERQ